MDILVHQSKQGNGLVPSRPDDVVLCDALDYRYRELCGLHMRVVLEELRPPSHLMGDMKLWRLMRMRHIKGDLRHTADELRAVRTICQWTVDVKCRLCKQPTKIIEWGD